MPSLRREKLGIISGRPQRLTLPVSAGRYRTCHDPTWKWETRQISGMMPIVVSPLVSTCSRAVENRIKSAIVHTSLSVLIHLYCRYCISKKVYVQNGQYKKTKYLLLLLLR